MASRSSRPRSRSTSGRTCGAIAEASSTSTSKNATNVLGSDQSLSSSSSAKKIAAYSPPSFPYCLATFVYLNGIYDVFCSVSILVYGMDSRASKLHLLMFNFYDDIEIDWMPASSLSLAVFRRFLAYWILTYGLLRFLIGRALMNVMLDYGADLNLKRSFKRFSRKKNNSPSSGVLKTKIETLLINVILRLVSVTYYVEGLIFLAEMILCHTIRFEKGLFVVFTSFFCGFFLEPGGALSKF